MVIVMARKKGDAESGRLGDRIYYIWHGRQCERAMPKHVANPQTEAQQLHRNSFAMISRLSSYMKEAHIVGLHWYAVREKNSTYAIFRRLNKDCFTAEGDVDYARVVVSKGALPKVDIVSAKVEGGVLTVGFDCFQRGDGAGEEFYIFVYNAALCAGFLTTPVLCSAGVVTAAVPSEWLEDEEGRGTEGGVGKVLHLYAFVRGVRGRTSDTIYYICFL